MEVKPTKYKKIACENIDYRKGTIEVSANIHSGLINLETNGVNPEVDLRAALNDDFGIEGKTSGGAELELSVEQARELIDQLQNAIAETMRVNGSS